MSTPAAPPAPWQTCLPVFRRYLARLDAWLDLAERHLGEAELAALLQTGLTPDMHPLASQIEIACNFVPRTLAPWLGQTEPDYGEFGRDLAGLRARIQARQVELDRHEAQLLASAASLTEIHFEAGQAQCELPAEAFVHQFALPNFFFHLSLAYALLRRAGVPLGKADFDGLHRYG